MLWQSHLYQGIQCFQEQRGWGCNLLQIYSKFNVNVLWSKSVSKQFEYLTINLEVSTGFPITVVGCYRPPTAVAETLISLTKLLADLNYSEVVLTGDLSWDWLKSPSDALKNICVALYLTPDTLHLSTVFKQPHCHGLFTVGSHIQCTPI